MSTQKPTAVSLGATFQLGDPAQDNTVHLNSMKLNQAEIRGDKLPSSNIFLTPLHLAG